MEFAVVELSETKTDLSSPVLSSSLGAEWS